MDPDIEHIYPFYHPFFHLSRIWVLEASIWILELEYGPEYESEFGAAAQKIVANIDL